jgi:hypothetical protein
MPKQKTPKGSAASAAPSDRVTDTRFSSFTTDPRFRLPSKKHARTKVDKRFSRMLKDEDFSNTAKVDRYGRKLSGSAKKEALQRLYQPEEDEDEDEEGSEAGVEVEDDDVVEKELKRAEKGYDAARGGGFSSSEDEEEEEEEEEVEVENGEEFPDMHEQSGVPMGEVSSRIAVVNLDWDNIRAVDLMAVFSSFVPAGGKIVKLSVYQSEFGKERMEREEMEGPPREIFGRQGHKEEEEEEEEEEVDSEDEEDGEDEEDLDDEEEDEKIKKELLKEDDGKEFDSAALRQYQLERLRYFYAVVVCSDNKTAEKIYESTDGTEYLTSANFFDLRFIPDGVDFDDKPRDECDGVPAGYRPTEFVTDALQHSKVKLTWDAEDTSRKDVIKRAFSGSRAEIGENDLKAYLGSDTSDDDEEEEEVAEEGEEAPKLSKKELARQKMRAAFGLGDEPTASSKKDKSGPVGDMEITFTAGLSAKEGGSVFQNEPIKDETTAEAYIRKEKERKARRKEKAKLIREGRDPAAAEEETAAPEENEDLGFDDPFFATDEAVKEKANKSLRKEERQKQREAKQAEADEKEMQRAELELLMTDNSTERPEDQLDHFDINEIARAEKLKGKKGKSKKFTKEKELAADGGKRGGMQKGFEMDVADPRFKAVFESHEFAIDPSNPKFKGTEGMKKLLEEGRKKRKLGDGEKEDVEEVRKRGSRGQKKGAVQPQEQGLSSLVESVRKKAKK